MCHVSQCWPFPSPLNHTGLFPHPSSHPHCSAALKGRAWHWNQHVSFSLLWWEQQKQPWSLPACACHTVPPHHQSHPAWRRRACVTLQTSAVLWALMGRLAEPEKSCDHRTEPSLSYLPRQLFKKPSSYEFSANIHPFCIVGKSGASMCWSPLQLSHLLEDMQALDASGLDSVSLIQRGVPCLQAPSTGCGGAHLGDESSSTKSGRCKAFLT